VNKARLIERIADLVNEKTIEEISDIRDESDRDGMRIVIELKRGSQPEIVLNQLYKHTSMQESFSMIFLAVVNNQPREMGLVQALQYFIDHRVDVVRRRTAFLLQKAKDRAHILEGYQKALDHLDHVIAIIRGSQNRAEARENLVAYFGGKTIAINFGGTVAKVQARCIERAWDSVAAVMYEPGKGPLPGGLYEIDPYGQLATLKTSSGKDLFEFDRTSLRPEPDAENPFSTKQADAILELQLHRLTRLSIDEIVNELNEQRARIAEYELILGSEKKLRSVIVQELKEILKDYGGPVKDPRRTIIQDEAKELQLEDLIADEAVAVTVSHAGYLKRTNVSIYRQQRRGGTGRKGMSTREEDFVEHMIAATTHNYILIFTNTGRVYWLKVYEIPDVSAAGKGKHIGNLVSLQPGETVRAFLCVSDLEEEGKYIFFTTRNGTVKKTPLKDFSNVMSRGIIAIGIDKDDELVSAQVTDGQQYILLATHLGMAVRFDEEDVRSMGRPAHGVRGMKLAEGDYIVGMVVTPKNATPGAEHKTRKKNREDESGEAMPNLILTVSENGYGKRTPVDDYRLTGRGAKGVINLKTTKKNGKVVAILLVSEESQAMLISQFGKIILMGTDTIREAGRATQGVKLIELEGDDRVAAAVVLPKEETNGNGNGDEPSLLPE
jgi:DNA gyrase subunit A